MDVAEQVAMEWYSTDLANSMLQPDLIYSSMACRGSILHELHAAWNSTNKMKR